MEYNNRRLRHEFKYLITPYYYEILKARLKNILAPDKNSGDDGEYRVTSLYFEDIYRSVYNDKVLGAKSRRKYRIRVYNLSADKITLEAKFKNDSYVSKTNAPLDYTEYKSILSGETDFYHASPEKWKDTALADFIVSNAVVKPYPSVVVDYFREAYVSPAGNTRITFDKRLSVCNTVDMLAPSAVFSPVLNGEIILEIKYDEFLPVYIAEILAGFPITGESISKFILCTDKLMEVKKQCVY